MTPEEPCDACNGTGELHWPPCCDLCSPVHECPYCDGSGVDS